MSNELTKMSTNLEPPAEFEGDVSDTTLHVNVPLLSDNECKQSNIGIFMRPGMICAGGEEGKDSCQVRCLSVFLCNVKMSGLTRQITFEIFIYFPKMK